VSAIRYRGMPGRQPGSHARLRSYRRAGPS